jgi:hypothetical protein
MHQVEVFERSWQLAQRRARVAQVPAAEVIASERVDEALGHAVAQRAAHRRVSEVDLTAEELEVDGLGLALRDGLVALVVGVLQDQQRDL